MNREDVIKEMEESGNFSKEHLDSITQEVIDNGIKNARNLPEGNWPEGEKPLGTNWSGNNFRIVNGIWHWDDKIGSMCGRERTWQYRPSPGATYRQTNNKCPQGYVWFEMYIPS